MFAPGPSKIVWTLFFYLLLQVTIYDAFILFFFKYWMKFISEATWIRRNIFLLLANLFYCFYIFECDEICTHHVTRLSCLDSLAVCDDPPTQQSQVLPFLSSSQHRCVPPHQALTLIAILWHSSTVLSMFTLLCHHLPELSAP